MQEHVSDPTSLKLALVLNALQQTDIPTDITELYGELVPITYTGPNHRPPPEPHPTAPRLGTTFILPLTPSPNDLQLEPTLILTEIVNEEPELVPTEILPPMELDDENLYEAIPRGDLAIMASELSNRAQLPLQWTDTLLLPETLDEIFDLSNRS